MIRIQALIYITLNILLFDEGYYKYKHEINIMFYIYKDKKYITSLSSRSSQVYR